MYIKTFCEYIDINIDTFWSTAEKFRGEMWTKENGHWKNLVSEELKNQLSKN